MRALGVILPLFRPSSRPRGVTVLAAAATMTFGGARAVWGQAVVAGTVRDSAGAPVFGAEVVVDGRTRPVRTDAAGQYRFRGVTAGPARLLVRRLGFRPALHEIVVPASGDFDVDVEVVAVPPTLAPVTVRAQRREAADVRLAGFYARQARRESGGHFITRDRIDRASSIRFTDLLRDIPGVRVGGAVRGGPTTAVRVRGNSCAPLVFIDGFSAGAGEFDLDILQTKSLEGVEVYSGIASLPAELSSSRDSGRCGVIAVWTRPDRPRPRRSQFSAASVDVRALLDSQLVYLAEQLEEPVRLTPGTGVPVYPDSLWRAQVTGRVLTEFVVDTAGVIEPATITVIATSHPLFAESARVALTTARFVPARRGGTPVRQFVQLPFVFAPQQASTGAPVSPRN